MIAIREYRETDAPAVGRLIASTYSQYNLAFATPEQLGLLLGPFRHADSSDPTHRAAIAEVIRSEMVFVADDEGTIAGVLRGRIDRLASLFVAGQYHRQGIGRRLVAQFESECRQRNATVIRLAATDFAVPFYLAMGYKRSTGRRTGWSFDGYGLAYQPMRKVLAAGQTISSSASR